MARPRASTVQEALPEQEKPQGGAQAQAQPRAQPQSRGALPTVKTSGVSTLDDLTALIYGAPKIGKSTLASEFEDFFFFDCEGGLKALEVYREPVTSWEDFLHWCGELAKHPGQFKGGVIDTVDKLSLYCSDYTNGRLGILHESDAEHGKGWSVRRKEFERALAKLAAMPGFGLIMLSHAKEVKIKTKNRTVTKLVPDLDKSAGTPALALADLILFLDFEGEDEEERRVIRTKPSAYWDAGERGQPPRLSETIEWPVGHGYDALKKAWEEGHKA